jgi:hypothetical protein
MPLLSDPELNRTVCVPCSIDPFANTLINLPFIKAKFAYEQRDLVLNNRFFVKRVGVFAKHILVIPLMTLCRRMTWCGVVFMLTLFAVVIAMPGVGF